MWPVSVNYMRHKKSVIDLPLPTNHTSLYKVLQSETAQFLYVLEFTYCATDLSVVCRKQKPDPREL